MGFILAEAAGHAQLQSAQKFDKKPRAYLLTDVIID
jgi:hypothetical protein